MSAASEQAAVFLAAKIGDEREGERRGATGEYERLRDLIEKDDLSEDENAEFVSLAEKRRAGTLEGRPRQTVYQRQSIAGERMDESGSPTTRPLTASEQAAGILQGKS